MTPDQIRNLKPGPELDRTIGEQLFQTAVFTDHAGRIYAAVRDGLASANLCAYSTTWAGLGLVVEEMERRGWYTGGGREIVPPDFPGQRMIGFGKPPGDPGELLGQAVSAATYMEAACKAALLALAAEKGEATP